MANYRKIIPVNPSYLKNCLLYYRAAEMPEHAHKAAMKELKRLKKMPQHMPEQAMIR